MLDDDEKRRIDQAASQYPTRRGAAIDALVIAQRRAGWICDETLREIADLLGMTPAELDAVATFYNLIYRRPVGRHVILVCDSVSCWLMGCDRVAGALRARLGVGWGGTTADGRFTLLPMACLGACDRAPVLMVGEDTHGDVAPERVDRILEGYAR